MNWCTVIESTIGSVSILPPATAAGRPTYSKLVVSTLIYAKTAMHLGRWIIMFCCTLCYQYCFRELTIVATLENLLTIPEMLSSALAGFVTSRGSLQFCNCLDRINVYYTCRRVCSFLKYNFLIRVKREWNRDERTAGNANEAATIRRSRPIRVSVNPTPNKKHSKILEDWGWIIKFIKLCIKIVHSSIAS